MSDVLFAAAGAAAPRIALIHATRLAIEPIQAAFERGWPEAGRFNLLEDSLPADRSRLPDDAPELALRFVALARYAEAAGASAILFTCSAFGPQIEAARAAVPLPVLKPNEAMFDAALAAGSRIGLVATFEPSIAPMRGELLVLAQRLGRSVELRTALADGAFAALERGEREAHDAAVEAAARTLGAGDGVDVLLLAQFSMARARERVAAAVDMPVLTSPDSAVQCLRERLHPRARVDHDD